MTDGDEEQQCETKSEFLLVKERKTNEGEVQLVEVVSNVYDQQGSGELISLRGAKRLIILLLALILLLFLIHLVFTTRIYIYVLQKCGSIQPTSGVCISKHGGCHVNATCTDENRAAVCKCNRGFIGNGTMCADIDECLLKNGGCHVHAICLNKIGYRECKCKRGHIGDGVYCKAAPVYLVNYRNCWNKCGGKGGRCTGCGPNGYCCRRGQHDCPTGYRNSAPPDRYACVLKMKN